MGSSPSSHSALSSSNTRTFFSCSHLSLFAEWEEWRKTLALSRETAQALSNSFPGGCNDVLWVSPAQTTSSSYHGTSRENLSQSMTSPTYSKAPPESMWAALPHIKRMQEPGVGCQRQHGLLGTDPWGILQTFSTQLEHTCQMPSHQQKPPKLPQTHLLISLTHILQRSGCFCSLELVPNTQVGGDEAQVMATKLQGTCATQLPAPPFPNPSQGTIRYKIFVTARTDLNF